MVEARNVRGALVRAIARRGRRRPHPGRQHGAALALGVLAVFAAAVAMLSASVALESLAAPATPRPASGWNPGVRAEPDLARVRDRILHWYAGHLAQLDGSDAFPLTPVDVLRAVDLDAAARLRFAAGPRAGSTASPWRSRRLAIWLSPRSDDRSGFGADGVFRPDAGVTSSLEFSSEALEREAYAVSERRLRSLATMQELRFVARLRADPDHDLARNWFRAADCRNPGDEPPCASSADRAPVTALMASLGQPFAGGPELDDARALNAWGDPNRYDNLPLDGDALPAGDRPPYAMRLYTTTPFGGTIDVVAVQPVE
ncbi:MAG TPA: hypothetical protein VMU33_09685 [Burkholderiaceae bacterium]|nr:hypothetical protein [Burkholderiaceae bacterium]